MRRTPEIHHRWSSRALVAAVLLGAAGCGSADDARETATHTFALKQGEVTAVVEPALAELQSHHFQAVSAVPQGTVPDLWPGAAAGELLARRSARGGIRSLFGYELNLDTQPASTEPKDLARAFLDRWGGVFGFENGKQVVDKHLFLTSVFDDPDLGTILRFDQVREDGTLIFHHDIRVWVTPDSRIIGVWGAVLPPLDIPLDVFVDAPTAESNALQLFPNARAAAADPTPAIFDPALAGKPGLPVLAWRVEVLDADIGSAYEVFLDTVQGGELHRASTIAAADTRDIYHWTTLGSGVPASYMTADHVFQRDPPAPDQQFISPWPATTEEANEAVGHIHAFLTARLSRDGWDNDDSSPIHSTQVYVTPNLMGNGFWTPSFGGLAALDIPLASVVVAEDSACTDVLAHEVIGHAVPSAEDVLRTTYEEAAALQEGIGDIFSELVSIHRTGSTDWRIGTPEMGCTNPVWPIRSLFDPEKDITAHCPTCRQRPAHHSNYGLRWGTSPSGTLAPHAGGNILGKMGYLMGRDASVGPEGHGGVDVTGVGPQMAGRFIYNAMRLSTRTTDFMEFGLMVRAATILSSSTLRTNVDDAVDSIGVWEGDFSSPFDSAHRPALIRFRDRPYAFTTEQRTATWFRFNLHTRTCPLFSSCGWTSTSLGWAGSSPGLAIAEGKLQIFYKYDINTNIRYRSISSTGSISGETVLPGTTDAAPAAVKAAFGSNEFSFVFHKSPGSGSQRIRYMVVDDDGTMLGGPFDTSLFSETGLAGVTQGGKTYVVYVRGGRFRMTDLSLTETTLPHQDVRVRGTPTATISRGRLQIAALAQDDGRPVYKSYCPDTFFGCTYRPGDWTSNVAIPHAGEDSTSHVALYGEPPQGGAPDTLYMFLGLPDRSNPIRLKESE